MTSRQQDDKRQMNNSPIGNELSRESLIQTVRLPILVAVSTDASIVDGRNATIKDSFLNFDSRKLWWNENSASTASTWQVGTNCLCYIFRYRQSVLHLLERVTQTYIRVCYI